MKVNASVKKICRNCKIIRRKAWSIDLYRSASKQRQGLIAEGRPDGTYRRGQHPQP